MMIRLFTVFRIKVARGPGEWFNIIENISDLYRSLMISKRVSKSVLIVFQIKARIKDFQRISRIGPEVPRN